MGYAANSRTASARRAKSPAAAADAAPAPAAVTPAEHSHRHAVVMRLKRVEGQIRGVMAMIDADASCDAVAQQLAAARKALDRAFYEMMACDFEQEIVRSSDQAQLARRLAEKTRLLAKYG